MWPQHRDRCGTKRDLIYMVLRGNLVSERSVLCPDREAWETYSSLLVNAGFIARNLLRRPDEAESCLPHILWLWELYSEFTGLGQVRRITTFYLPGFIWYSGWYQRLGWAWNYFACEGCCIFCKFQYNARYVVTSFMLCDLVLFILFRCCFSV